MDCSRGFVVKRSMAENGICSCFPLVRLAFLVGVLLNQLLHGDEAVALLLQLGQRLLQACYRLATVAATVVHQDDVAGACALDTLRDNIGAGTLPVGSVHVPADFRRYEAVKVGCNRRIEVAAGATEDAAARWHR